MISENFEFLPKMSTKPQLLTEKSFGFANGWTDFVTSDSLVVNQFYNRYCQKWNSSTILKFWLDLLKMSPDLRNRKMFNLNDASLNCKNFNFDKLKKSNWHTNFDTIIFNMIRNCLSDNYFCLNSERPRNLFLVWNQFFAIHIFVTYSYKLT